MRLLDELADILHQVRPRNGVALRVVRSELLDDQFAGPVTPARWSALGRRVPLPLLAFDAGRWWLPLGFTTVWDVCDRMAVAGGGEPPDVRTVDAWVEAQVFAGVRTTLVDALNVAPEQVVREARLRDLGAE